VEKGAAETLSYYAFPSQHWRSLRTNNPLERLMREIRRRTRVVGAFPDGQVSVDARCRPSETCGRYQVGLPAVSEHGSAQRTPVGDSIISEPRGLYGPRLSISSKPTDCWAAENKSAKNSLHYRSRGAILGCTIRKPENFRVSLISRYNTMSHFETVQAGVPVLDGIRKVSRSIPSRT
jgi:hypothetical protein